MVRGIRGAREIPEVAQGRQLKYTRHFSCDISSIYVVGEADTELEFNPSRNGAEREDQTARVGDYVSEIPRVSSSRCGFIITARSSNMTLLPNMPRQSEQTGKFSAAQ